MGGGPQRDSLASVMSLSPCWILRRATLCPRLGPLHQAPKVMAGHGRWYSELWEPITAQRSPRSPHQGGAYPGNSRSLTPSGRPAP